MNREMEKQGWEISTRTKDAVSLVLLLAAVLLFFQKALQGGRTLIWDAADYFYPYFFTVSSSLRSWEIPLWNPFLFNGFPTIANIEAQVFYPVNLLFLPFSPFTPYAVQLSLILHCLLAGAFMYLLARNSIENRQACLVSALAYMFSGFIVGHFEHVTIVEVMAWLPLVFLLLEKALTEKKAAYAVFAGFFLGVSILAGHPQTSHNMVVVLAAYTVYRASAGYIKEKDKNVLFYAAAMLAVCLGMGSLIAAAQILPTYELVRESTRGSAVAVDFAAKSAQFSLRDAVLLFVPNYFGALTGPYWGDLDISQNIIYIGVAPLLLAGLALFEKGRRSVRLFFFITALFFLVVALGENGPFFAVLYRYLPGFKYFRGPANTIVIYTFCAALLAGYGFESLARGLKKRTFLIYAGTVLIFCAVVYKLGPAPPAEIALWAAKNMQSGFWVFLGFFIISAVTIFISISYPRFRNHCFTVLALVTFADLYLHFSGAATIGAEGPPRMYEEPAPIISIIKNYSGIESGGRPAVELNDSEVGRGLFRIYTKPEGVQGTVPLGINRAMLFGTFLVEGFEPLEVTRHRRLIETLSVKNPDNLYKITNSAYIVSTGPAGPSVRRYAEPLPRAYIVSNAIFIDNDERVLEELAAFDPRAGVIISGKGADMTGRPTDAPEQSATVSRYTGRFVEIRTQSRRDGFLVLSDTYYPGWQAWVDGVEYPVLRANYDFRAVRIPAGNHTVVFKFTSRYLAAGIAISLAGLALAGYFFIRSIFIGRRTPKLAANGEE